MYFKKILTVHKGFYVYFENETLCLVNDEIKRIAMKNKIVIKKDFLTDELFTE